ncbi:MAG: SDR family oxidoreductase, partial [Chloroflexi bacterium]|nr:SDR family oxidoreductase [Chloroflexota bacterium]
ATSPTYWAEHLRAAVRFGDGLASLLDEPSRLLLEVGPGQTLARLARRHPARQPAQTAVSTLPHPTDRQSDLDSALLAAGRLWAAGVPLDPSGLWPAGGHRVALPTYPFERQEHWIDAVAPTAVDTGALPRRMDPTDWLYAPSWRRVARTVGGRAATRLRAEQRWLLFCDTEGLGLRLAKRLRAAGQQVACVTPGVGFSFDGGDAYTLDPAYRSGYSDLLAALRDSDGLPERIVHLWSATAEPDAPAADTPATDAPDQMALERGFYSLLYLGQALGEQPGAQPVELSVVTQAMHVILGDETVQPERAAVLGPCRVIPQEYPHVSSRSIDVGRVPADAKQIEELVGRLLDDLTGEPSRAPLAYRGTHRWVQAFEPIQVSEEPHLRERGVYLIVGGLGGVGLAIARYLAQTVQARLVLAGRSAFPSPEAWDGWLAEHPDDDPTSARIRHLRDLEAAGGEVVVERADVTDPAAVAGLVTRVLNRYGGLHGVVHAAGVPGDGIVQLKAPQVAAAVLAPKVAGSLALAAALRDVPDCDFLVLCSSLSAILGGAGQVDYCAANAFQDALANARAERAGRPGPRILSINWDAWEEAGMWARSTTNGALAALQPEAIRDGIRPDEGALAFAYALETGLPHVVISTRDFTQRVARWAEPVPSDARTSAPASVQVLTSHSRPALATPLVAPRDAIERRVAAIWQDLLGIDEVGIHDNFIELGGHSLLGLQLTARLRDAFGAECTLLQLFEAPTVAELAALVREQAGDGTTDPALAEMMNLVGQLSEQELSDLLARVTVADVQGEGS